MASVWTRDTALLPGICDRTAFAVNWRQLRQESSMLDEFVQYSTHVNA